jgi:tRNA pseudouridine55 synthase
MVGRKRYRFTVRWGEERDTDDAEGKVIGRRRRPTPKRWACLRRSPVPSAGAAQILRRKIEGERA